MFLNLKHIFIFTLIFSVFSITLQASVIHICKENKLFKVQNSAVTEEEEESHETNDSVDELIYLNHDSIFMLSALESNKLFFIPIKKYISIIASIIIPPPKS